MTKCFVHPDRPSVIRLNIPCAPGGGLDVCAECAKPEGLEAVFKAYKAKNQTRIKLFKTPGDERN